MKKLIKRILREEINKSDKYYRFLDKISSIIEIPYFSNMYEKNNGGFWDITDEDDQLYILKNIFGEGITLSLGNYYSGTGIYDKNKNYVYHEFIDDTWKKWERDNNGNVIYQEDSSGFWMKWEYDDNGNMLYQGNSDGFWRNKDYDDKGNVIYSVDSDGDWWEWEYDDKGNLIFYQDSYGVIRDNR